jgi:peptidoglycan/LPS O-acetylase OafA/YrhL
MYIFGWPISQTLIHASPGLGVRAVIVLSLLLATIVALPSWLFVERPAMRTRARLVAALRQQLPWLRPRDEVRVSKF